MECQDSGSRDVRRIEAEGGEEMLQSSKELKGKFEKFRANK